MGLVNIVIINNKNYMNIEVLKDTLIVKENTKDALQVKIEKETPVSEKQIEVNGQIIKGDNLVVTEVTYENLGRIKERISALDEQIARLIAEKETLVNKKTLIEPELDKAITDILKNPESQDMRTVESPVLEAVEVPVQ
jgi:uncharacterized small protein (DUF1192 family)